MCGIRSTGYWSATMLAGVVLVGSMVLVSQGADATSHLESVVGEWDHVSTFMGQEYAATLTVTNQSCIVTPSSAVMA